MLKEKPIQQFGTVVESNTTEFQIDITPKLFEMLSGLYSNKIRAVIREILCNAIDSHIVAGHNEPVRIIMPTEKNPNLTIQDFGIGMSPEAIVNVYTRYSKSTKAHDASTTGALGLGSKSPFCYTTMFSLISIHDGIKSTYNVYINRERIPSLTVVKSEPSDDDNGVTVTIPVKVDDIEDFGSSLRFVMLHTKFPVSIFTKCEVAEGEFEYVDQTNEYATFNALPEWTTNNNTHLFKHDPWGVSSTGMYVLQANVIYPIHDKTLIEPLLSACLKKGRVCVVFEVPNGSVSFTPTREELSLDMDTIDFIVERVSVLERKIKSWAKMYACIRDKLHLLAPKIRDHVAWSYCFNYNSSTRDESEPKVWHAQYRNVRYGPNKYDYDNKKVPIKGVYECDTRGCSKVSLTSMNRASSIAFIEYDPNWPEGISTTTVVQNYVKHCIVNGTEPVDYVFILGEAPNTVRKILCRIKYTKHPIKIDWNLYLKPPKKVREPGTHTPIQFFELVVDADTEDTSNNWWKNNTADITTVKSGTMDGYDSYAIREGRNILLDPDNNYEKYLEELKLTENDPTVTPSVIKQKHNIATMSFDEFCTVLKTINTVFMNTNNPHIKCKVALLTKSQYVKLVKDVDFPRFMLDLYTRTQSVYDAHAWYNLYDGLNDSELRAQYTTKLEYFYANDEHLKRAVRRIEFEIIRYNRWKRKNVVKLPQANRQCPQYLIHTYQYHRISSDLKMLPMIVNRSKVMFGITLVDHKLVGFNESMDMSNIKPSNVFAKYIKDVWIPNNYNLDEIGKSVLYKFDGLINLLGSVDSFKANISTLTAILDRVETKGDKNDTK